MSYAITYRGKGFFVSILFFVVLAVFLGAVSAKIPPSLAVIIFTAFLILLLRVPLMFLARSVKKVRVEKIAEVEIKPKEVFKAMIRHSNAYKLTLFAFTPVILSVLTSYSNLVFPLLSVLILLLTLPVFENTKIMICREGVVDSRLVLLRWSDVVSLEERGEWIILRRRLDFPILLPKSCRKYLNFDSLHK